MRAALRRLFDHRTIGFGLAGLAMLAVFLYLRFPGDTVTDSLRAAFASRFAGTRLTLSPVRPLFPPGLGTDQVSLHFPGQPEGPLRIDRLSVRLRGLSLLQARLALLVAAEGYGGRLEGRIDFSGLAPRGLLSAEGQFREVRTEKSDWLRELLFRPLTGQLKGVLSYSGNAESLRTGTGQIEFTLANGTYPLREPLLGLDRIDFSRIEGKIGFRNGTLQLSQLTLTGEKLRLSLKGSLLPAEPWPESPLELAGTAELVGQGNKRVRVTIDGTVGNPRTRIQ